MDSWLASVSLADLVGVLVWIVTVGGTLLTLRKWTKPLVDRLRLMLDDWQGEPSRPGVPARPGVMETLGTQTDKLSEHTRRLEVIEAVSKSTDFHSRPNHGTSAYDASQRHLDDMTSRLERIEKLLDFLHTDTPKEN